MNTKNTNIQNSIIHSDKYDYIYRTVLQKFNDKTAPPKIVKILEIGFSPFLDYIDTIVKIFHNMQIGGLTNQEDIFETYYSEIYDKYKI